MSGSKKISGLMVFTIFMSLLSGLSPAQSRQVLLIGLTSPYASFDGRYWRIGNSFIELIIENTTDTAPLGDNVTIVNKQTGFSHDYIYQFWEYRINDTSFISSTTLTVTNTTWYRREYSISVSDERAILNISCQLLSYDFYEVWSFRVPKDKPYIEVSLYLNNTSSNSMTIYTQNHILIIEETDKTSDSTLFFCYETFSPSLRFQRNPITYKTSDILIISLKNGEGLIIHMSDYGYLNQLFNRTGPDGVGTQICPFHRFYWLPPGRSFYLTSFRFQVFTGDYLDGLVSLRETFMQEYGDLLYNITEPTYSQWYDFWLDFNRTDLEQIVPIIKQLGVKWFIIDGGWEWNAYPLTCWEWDSARLGDLSETLTWLRDQGFKIVVHFSGGLNDTYMAQEGYPYYAKDIDGNNRTVNVGPFTANGMVPIWSKIKPLLEEKLGVFAPYIDGIWWDFVFSGTHGDPTNYGPIYGTNNTVPEILDILLNVSAKYGLITFLQNIGERGFMNPWTQARYARKYNVTIVMGMTSSDILTVSTEINHIDQVIRAMQDALVVPTHTLTFAGETSVRGDNEHYFKLTRTVFAVRGPICFRGLFTSQRSWTFVKNITQLRQRIGLMEFYGRFMFALAYPTLNESSALDPWSISYRDGDDLFVAVWSPSVERQRNVTVMTGKMGLSGDYRCFEVELENMTISYKGTCTLGGNVTISSFIPANGVKLFYLTKSEVPTCVMGTARASETFANQRLYVELSAPSGTISETTIYVPPSYDMPYYVKIYDQVYTSPLSTKAEFDNATYNCWYYDSDSRLLYVKVEHYSVATIEVSWQPLEEEAPPEEEVPPPPPPPPEEERVPWEYYLSIIMVIVAVIIIAVAYKVTYKAMLTSLHRGKYLRLRR